LKHRLIPSDRARALAASLSFRELLDQCSCPVLNVEEPRAPYGAGFIGWRTPAELRERIGQLKGVNPKIPPLVTSDMECGAGRMVKGFPRFPDLMALGAAGDEALAYAVGKATAEEAVSLGYHWTLGPVVDLATNPDSPVVSSRSAGSRVESVLRFAGAYLRGLQDHGLMATLKHFPGDGTSTFDQHLTTPQIPLTLDQWRGGPGLVYRELIDRGAKCVMVGHLGFPAVDPPDAKLGISPPATVSEKIIRGLLGDELGFEGLLVSDAVGMAGLTGFLDPYEACARWWECGGDVLLFQRTGEMFYRKMEALRDAGKLRETTLRDRAARILAAKEDLGLFGQKKTAVPDLEAHEKLATEVIRRSVTLVRDRNQTLPVSIQPHSRVLHLVVAVNYLEEKETFDAVTTALHRRAERVEEWVDPGPRKIHDAVAAGQFDLVVCSIGAPYGWGVGTARLTGPVCRNLMEGWMRLGVPVVFLNHFHPFTHLEFDVQADTVVATYRSLPETAERVVKGLTGEEPFEGKTP